jgi:hypothetical protein
MKHQLKDLANQEKCTVPDVIRAAIEQYLASQIVENTSEDASIG